MVIRGNESGAARLRATAIALSLLLLGGCASTVDGSGLASGSLPPAPEQKLAEPPELALARGEALLATGNHAEAHAKFALVLKSEPDNFQARIGAAEASLGAGHLGEALAGFESALESDEFRPQALQGRGITLTLIGRPDLGQEVLLQAVELEPALWRAWNAIGRNHDLANQPDHALEAYQNALRANPGASAIHNNLGLALTALGRPAEAEKSFRTALQLTPQSPQAQANLRLVMARQGRYSEALVGVKAAQLPSVLNNVGFIAMQQGDFDVAKAYFVRAMETSPSFYEKAAKNLDYLEELKKTAAATMEAQG